MHTEILTAAQLAVLKGLRPIASIREFYLAGGTDLALRHGHRRSIDFHFFRPSGFSAWGLLLTLERAFGDLERLPAADDTLFLRLHGVTSTFFRYPYPLLEPVEPSPWGFGLASDLDIAAMKIEAVAGRGARKDFVDCACSAAAG